MLKTGNLAGTAIATTLFGLVAVPANAVPVQPVQLTDAMFSYEIDSPIAGGTLAKQSSPVPISPELVTPFPISAFSTGTGTSSGGYGLFADSNRDNVHATIRVEAPGVPPGGDEGAVITLSASTSYQVAVNVKLGKVPPDTIKAVPVIAMATGSVMCGDGAVAVADVSVDLLQPLDNPAFASCGSQNPVQIPSFKSQLTGLFPIGEPLNIIKAVNGTLGLDVVDGGIDTGMFDATADPTIQIDPSFAFADDFELDFSPGFSAGTTSDVPEPSSLTLLAAAFIVLAIIPRRSLLSPRTARLPLTFAQGSA